jgi:hypothetical protein
MPTNGGELGLRPAPPQLPQGESWMLSSLDRLRSDVQRLSLHRQDVYGRAHVLRESGHLVPSSLCEELAQNESQLRCALDRYIEATGDAHPAEG